MKFTSSSNAFPDALKLVGFISAVLFWSAPVSVHGFDTPVTPNASPRAQSLLAYLWSVYGQKILSGQHESQRGTNQLGYELRYIKNVTGKLPAIRSMDIAVCLGPTSNTSESAEQFVSNATNWYLHSNGIVMLCWHWPAPIGKRAFYTRETDFDVSHAVVEGTAEHTAIVRDIDQAAVLLKKLRDAHVPVLWRPLHEANGRWFWWGAKGPDPFRKLWRLLFDQLTHKHKLDNLIWVFSPGAAIELAAWYPGDAYVDIIGMDHYPLDGNRGAAKDIFDELVALRAGTKLVGLSETGPIPDPDKLIEQKAFWLCFVTWSGRVLTRHNSEQQLHAVYNHPHVITLEQMPDLKRFPYPRVGRPVQLGLPVQVDQLPVGGPARLPIVVAVQDAHGHTVRNGKFNVSISLLGYANSGLLAGTTSTYTVNGIAEFADISIAAPGSNYAFVAGAPRLRSCTSKLVKVGPGTGLLREWWLGTNAIDQVNPAQLTVTPTGRELLGKAFEVGFDPATNYLARYRGWVIAPVSGQYIFWLASSPTATLWLGTNSLCESKRLVATVTSSTPYAKWPHINEAKSDPVTLEAGQRYYIEVVQKQKVGSTHLAVRWHMPNTAEKQPIPAWCLMPVEP